MRFSATPSRGMPLLAVETKKYDSDGPTPSLDDSLFWTREKIMIQYWSKEAASGGPRADDAWNHVLEWWDSSSVNTASRLTRIPYAMIKNWPHPEDALFIANAFWIEAAVARDGQEPDRAWAALMQSNYYLGMASGPNSSYEIGARGGSARRMKYAPLRALVLRWLDRLPEASFTSAKAVREAVLPKVKNFCRRFPNHRSTNPEGLLEEWSKKDPEVRAAVGRLVRGGIQRGRKKNSPPDSTPNAT